MRGYDADALDIISALEGGRVVDWQWGGVERR